MNSDLSTDEKIKLAHWLILRHDTLRGATASRAAIVLSAAAIFFTGIIFFVDKFLLRDHPPPVFFIVLSSIIILVTLLLLILSIIKSLGAIVTVFKPSRDIMKFNKNERLFYNAKDTIDSYRDIKDFKGSFNSYSKDEYLNFALSEFWSSYKLYRLRYDNMRSSVRFFLFAISIFLFGLFINTSLLLLKI